MVSLPDSDSPLADLITKQLDMQSWHSNHVTLREKVLNSCIDNNWVTEELKPKNVIRKTQDITLQIWIGKFQSKSVIERANRP